MIRFRVALIVLLALSAPARAQVIDSFDDGDFIRNPRWHGDVDRWAVELAGSDYMLRSTGAAKADTIYLSTPSRVAYGTWSFSFSYTDANLSNFNGARIYLLADHADLTGDIQGYFLQFGTNNSDEIRLYRQDGNASSKRVELGRSELAWLLPETQALDVTVIRSQKGSWSVRANEIQVVTAQDDTYTTSAYFGVWVKHTASAARAYAVDDVQVLFNDDAPPHALFAEQIGENEIEIVFDEALDPSSVDAVHVDIDGNTPEAIRSTGSTRLQITFPPGTLTSAADWQLHMGGVRDLAGNDLTWTTLTVARLADAGDIVINEIMFAPVTSMGGAGITQPEYMELYNRTERTLTLSGFYRTREPDATGDADTLGFAAPSTALPPNGYALVFADTNTVQAARHAVLIRAFPGMDLEATEIRLLPVRRSSLGLRNEGDLIRIHRRDGTIVDEVRYAPEWHNPVLADARGIALERIDSDSPSQEGENWGSSPDPSGGTPAAANLLSRTPDPGTSDFTVTVAPSPFSPDSDGFDDVALVRYATTYAGGSVRIRIFDSRGRLARTLVPSAISSPIGEYEWDGLDDAGSPLRVGIYIAVVDAAFPNEGVTRTFKKAIVLARALD